MPPKAARESSRVKPKVGIVAGNGQGAHQVYLSRIATYFTGASFSVSSGG
jgi:hypothetical protein